MVPLNDALRLIRSDVRGEEGNFSSKRAVCCAIIVL
jgi:hypothetical protein